MNKLLIGTALSFSLHVFSYTFTSDFQKGNFWSEFPIQFKVLEDDSVEYDRLEKITNEAIAMWEASLFNPSQIWNFVLTSPGEGSQNENHIRWSKDFVQETEGVFDPNSTLAVTIRHSREPLYIRTEIVLNNSLAYLMDDDFLRTVILHELGHTVGLGHSKDRSAIMYAYLDYYDRELAKDDIDGINAVTDEISTRQSSPITIRSAATKEQNSSSSPVSCGTIDLNDKNGPGGNNFAVNIMLSMLFGFLLSYMGKMSKARLYPRLFY